MCPIVGPYLGNLRRWGNLAGSKNLTVGTMTYKQQNCVCEFFFTKYFSMGAIFVQAIAFHYN